MKFHFRAGLAGLAALMLIVPAPARAQDPEPARAQQARAPEVPAALKGTASLQGKVVDEKGKGVPQPKVTLVSAKDNAQVVVEGKGGGDFEVKNIKAGAYRMVVETPNYVTVRQDVTVAEGKGPKISVVSKNDASPELLQKATALAQAGDIAGARTEYLKVLEAHPELTSINRFIAFTYGKEGNTAEALKYLDAALAGTPDDTALLQLAADSATKLNQFEKASGYIQKIDFSAATDPAPYMNMAVANINANRQADAVPLLNKLIARWPEVADLYFFRAYANMGLKKEADAEPDFEKYLQLDPNGAHAADAKKILTENIAK